MPDTVQTELLELRRQEIVEAFATVLSIIDLCTEMHEVIPPGVYNYLWNKWFKLDGLKFDD